MQIGQNSLWYGQNDQKDNFDSYKSFGGFGMPTMKNYAKRSDFCGYGQFGLDYQL